MANHFKSNRVLVCGLNPSALDILVITGIRDTILSLVVRTVSLIVIMIACIQPVWSISTRGISVANRSKISMITPVCNKKRCASCILHNWNRLIVWVGQPMTIRSLCAIAGWCLSVSVTNTSRLAIPFRKKNDVYLADSNEAFLRNKSIDHDFEFTIIEMVNEKKVSPIAKRATYTIQFAWTCYQPFLDYV